MQKFITPNGETLVIMPLADYEALIDAADIAAADKVKADISAGLDELVPGNVVHRIVHGENPIRVWREYRGMKAKDLAAAADITPAYLSEIETGKKDGSIKAIKAIAAALKVDMDDLV
ncbi:MAG: helix-turn-helix domain-containing protein [Roseibium sp.]|nr:helix-turn-helix domain-containing protein [Roseibium sp.]